MARFIEPFPGDQVITAMSSELAAGIERQRQQAFGNLAAQGQQLGQGISWIGGGGLAGAGSAQQNTAVFEPGSLNRAGAYMPEPCKVGIRAELQSEVDEWLKDIP